MLFEKKKVRNPAYKRKVGRKRRVIIIAMSKIRDDAEKWGPELLRRSNAAIAGKEMGRPRQSSSSSRALDTHDTCSEADA